MMSPRHTVTGQARSNHARLLALAAFFAGACSGTDGGDSALRADYPLHLEEHLDQARIEGAALPDHAPVPIEWSADEIAADWLPLPKPGSEASTTVEPTEDALRIVLNEETASTPVSGTGLQGGIFLEVAEWNREDWSHIAIELRTETDGGSIWPAFNILDHAGSKAFNNVFEAVGEYAPIAGDGNVHTYLLRADWAWQSLEAPWRQLVILVSAPQPASVDIVTIRLIPKAANYADAGFGVRTEPRGGVFRRALYVHTPARIDFDLVVPDEGRLDVDLGVLRDDVRVDFRVWIAAPGDDRRLLLDESSTDKETWNHAHVDLSAWGGQRVELSLETDAEQPGTIGMWGAPTVSGARRTDRPNVIFYVIDGAAADLMSVYGYNRRTTPFLERLAAEGAVFDRAYSNSTWTKVSTPSFMTSLHTSVLGGYESDNDPLPVQAQSMAQRFHAAGYQTGVFTTNPYAGTLSSLERGVDALRETETASNSTSSVVLHDDFWQWRRDFPGEPYWVHFQTTDVHWPYFPVFPFAGTFVDPEARNRFHAWEKELAAAEGFIAPDWPARYSRESFESTGIDPVAFYEVVRGLYDESMAHNDHQLGRLVERLKASGEWDRTLLIVAADHGSDHANRLLNEYDIGWRPIMSGYRSHIPMIVVWPGVITPGQRYADPVSMIDMLPTILELSNLPAPELYQGQSLAPLLTGVGSWQPQPVILDEFYVGANGELTGLLEVIDGRWGAVMSITPVPWSERPPRRRGPAPVSLYDLWTDPFTRNSLHDEYPELVAKYRDLLEERWASHRELATGFTRTPGSLLTPDQMETLRALGYIR